MIIIASGDSYDIVVGIPSYNEEDTIRYVAEQIDKGLRAYFPDKKAIIVNVDSCSPDNTKEAFLGARTETKKHFERVTHPIRGKGSNFHWLFQFIKEANPEAVAVVDADLKSITPEWMKYLLTPILEGADFVTPYYARHKYDGTITNNVCYPLVYGVMGVNLRQPIGGDFAFSTRLNNYWLEQEWTTTTRQYGIDIFMTLHAIMGGFSICEVSLGSKIHKPSAPKLNEMFLQVCDSIFRVITENIAELESRSLVSGVSRTGMAGIGVAQDLAVDPVAILNTVMAELDEHWGLVEKYLGERWVGRLGAMREIHRFIITADDWIELLFTLLKAYADAGKSAAKKKEVVTLLRPLYFARTLTFINATLKLSTPEAEKLIVAQADRLRSRRKELFELFALAPEKQAFVAGEEEEEEE